MADSYDSSGHAEFPDLDEYLTEYVDGQMDPKVAAVFEELLRNDPELAERVRQLRAIRQALQCLHNRCRASRGFETRLRQRIALESIREMAAPVYFPLSHPELWISASLLVLLLSGLLILQANLRPSSVTASQDAAIPEMMLLEADAFQSGERRLTTTAPILWQQPAFPIVNVSGRHLSGPIQPTFQAVPPERIDSLRRLFYTSRATVLSP